MPNNVHSTNVVVHFIKTTPPVTRILVLLTVLVSLTVYLDILAPQQIGYSRFYLKDLELHRIFTSFFYYGRGNFELVMNFIFLYRYSSMLEESYGRTSDYFYVIITVLACLFITSTALYMPFLATALSNTLTYLWTRKNPQSIVQMFGFVSFSAFYLPFIFPVITLVFEGHISKDEIVGIAVGHFIFYFTEVYPRFGKNFLATPCVLHKLFKEECELCKAKKIEPTPVLSETSSSGRRHSEIVVDDTVVDDTAGPTADVAIADGSADQPIRSERVAGDEPVERTPPFEGGEDTPRSDDEETVRTRDNTEQTWPVAYEDALDLDDDYVSGEYDDFQSEDYDDVGAFESEEIDVGDGDAVFEEIVEDAVDEPIQTNEATAASITESGPILVREDEGSWEST